MDFKISNHIVAQTVEKYKPFTVMIVDNLPEDAQMNAENQQFSVRNVDNLQDNVWRNVKEFHCDTQISYIIMYDSGK